jgi:hypothetical protein
MGTVTLTTSERDAMDRLRRQIGMRATARQLSIGHMAAYRALSGRPIRPGTATQIRVGLALATPRQVLR